MNPLLAKRTPLGGSPNTLVEHTSDVVEAAECLFGPAECRTRLGSEWLRFFRLDSTHWLHFHDNLLAASLFHDWGKANKGMQDLLAGGSGGQPNKERQFHVDRDIIFRVIDAAPSAEWRLIIALSRFGGLRCPSEHLALRWQDVDWDRNRFRVDSPKTGERWIPIFPELRPYFDECFALAKEGAVNVITSYRSDNVNMRMQLERIIRRAGLKPWPKLFHNLRASRQTELAAEYPIHVVCAWIGNTAAIAAKHYLTVRETDFQRASEGGAESGALEAQKQAQHTSVPVCTASQELTEDQGHCEDMHEDAEGRKKTSRSVQVPGGLGTLRRSRKVRRVKVPVTYHRNPIRIGDVQLDP